MSTATTPTLQPTNTAAVSPSPTPTPTPNPTPTPRGGPAPTALAGSWVSTTAIGIAVETMTLSGTNYRLGEAFGNIAVNKNQISFFNGPCNGVGVYQWTVHGGILHFTLIGDDPCGRRPDLENRDYKRLTG